MTNENPTPQPQSQPTPHPQPNPEPQPKSNREPNPEPQPQPNPEPQLKSNREPQQGQANTYEYIIEQQQEQINALLNQTKTLNEQIVSMVANGAQFNQQQPQPQPQPQSNPMPPSLSDDADWTLEGLAKEIGKKND